MTRKAVFSESAAWALALGFAIFPLAERSKEPLANSHGHKDATRDAGRVGDWGQGLPYCNVGIRCGAESNLFVLDVDVREAKGDKPAVDGFDTLTAYKLQYGDLPATLTIRTGGGGRQYYFRHIDGAGNKVGFGDGLDTRAEGGYVAAPGSIHPNGNAYTVEVDAPIADAPAWLAELVRKPVVERPAPEAVTPSAIAAIPDDRRTSYVRSVIARETEALALMAADSGRNDALNRAAFKIGSVLHFAPALQSDAEAALMDACSKNGLAGESRRGDSQCKATIASGLRGGLSNPRAWPGPSQAPTAAQFLAAVGVALPKSAEAGAVNPSGAPAGRPVITFQTSNIDLTITGSEAIAALVRGGSTYSQSGVLSQIVPMAGHDVIARPYTALTLGPEMARAATWQTWHTLPSGEKKAKGIAPPPKVVDYVLGTPPRLMNVPELDGITSTPIMRDDGSIATAPGYDKASAVYHAAVPGFTMPAVPDKPTPTDIAAALDILDEAFIDIKFEDDAAKANAYGAMLTLAGKRLYTGSTPAFLITAPQQGNGKTMLGKGIIYAATGQLPSVITVSQDGAEMRKQITSELLNGSPAALFDNVVGTLENSDLAALVTGGQWKDRLLGGNTQVSIPIRSVWFFTGNNVRAGGDMVRRIVPINLDAKVSYAYKQGGWHHKSFLGNIKDERGAIAWALYTLLRAWVAAGRPVLRDGPIMGSFEGWAEMVGGVLAIAGRGGFLDNLARFESSADAESLQWEEFLLAIRQVFGLRPASAGEIFDKFNSQAYGLGQSVPDVLQPFLRDDKRGIFVRTLSNHFMGIVNKRHGDSGARIEWQMNRSTHTKEWKVILNDSEEMGRRARVSTEAPDTHRNSIYDGLGVLESPSSN